MAYRFYVQSDKYSPEYIIDRINVFLLGKRGYMKDISDEDFEKARESVMTKLAEKDKTLY